MDGNDFQSESDKKEEIYLKIGNLPQEMKGVFPKRSL